MAERLGLQVKALLFMEVAEAVFLAEGSAEGAEAELLTTETGAMEAHRAVPRNQVLALAQVGAEVEARLLFAGAEAAQAQPCTQ